MNHTHHLSFVRKVLGLSVLSTQRVNSENEISPAISHFFHCQISSTVSFQVFVGEAIVEGKSLQAEHFPRVCHFSRPSQIAIMRRRTTSSPTCDPQSTPPKISSIDIVSHDFLTVSSSNGSRINHSVYV